MNDNEIRNVRTLQDVEDRRRTDAPEETKIKKANINARDKRKARVLHPALIVEHEERNLVATAISARKGPAA